MISQASETDRGKWGYVILPRSFHVMDVSTGKEKFMLSENQRKIFADFHKSVEAEGVLDDKTSHMIKIAAAIAFGCYPWIEQLLGVAREKGISDDEIGAVQLHVMMVSSGRIMMQVDDLIG